MEKIKLTELGLNKQALKRKAKNITSNILRLGVEAILNRRTAEYMIDDIEYILNAVYSSKEVNSDEPLSIYYSQFNKERFNNLKNKINQRKCDDSVIRDSVKELVYNSHNELYTYDKFKEEQTKLSKNFGINITDIEKIVYEEENYWFSRINKRTIHKI